jgi:hypothetical protein
MQVGKFVAETIHALFLGEDPLEKTFPLPVKHAANAFDLDHVTAETEKHAAGWKNKVHGRSSE